MGSPYFLTSFLCLQKPGARMAGLEVLFASAAPAITCAQDALVCFLHWEVVTHGYYALGTGDQVRQGAGLELGGGAKVSSAQTHRTWSGAPHLPLSQDWDLGFMTPVV